MANKHSFKTSFLIGVFILTGLTMLVGFLLWMGATQFLKKYNYYVTYFSESVVGLEDGSAVKYLGVSCGVVDKISVAPDGKLVQVILKIDPSLKVTDKIICKLEMAGLAGGKFIQLINRENNTVRNYFYMPFEPPHPIIHSAASQLDEVVADASSIISELKAFKWQEISDELSGTLQGSNQLLHSAELKGIISDLRQTTTSLNELTKQLAATQLANDITATSTSIVNTAKQLENFSEKLNITLDSVNIPVYVERMYSDFSGTLNKANNAINIISSKFQSSVLGVNILMEDVNKTSKTLRKTLQNINESPYIFLTEPPKADKMEED